MHISLTISFVFQFVLADNLAAKNMMIDQYIAALESDKFHGYDIGLRVLSRLLKMTIGVWNSRHVWLSSPNINVFEVSVMITIDNNGHCDATGSYSFNYNCNNVSGN